MTNIEKMDKNLQYKIVHKTDDGSLLIEIEGLRFWIHESWIGKDGTLDEKAKKAFKGAKNIDQKARDEAKKERMQYAPIDVRVLLEDGTSAKHENVNLGAVCLTWLKELTNFVDILYSHQKMRDPNNQIYSFNVWEKIRIAIKDSNSITLSNN